MNLELRWQENVWTSCLHAAQIVAGRNYPVDEALAASIGPIVEEMLHELYFAGISDRRFWRHVLPLSARHPGKAELARIVVGKTSGLAAADSPAAERVGQALTALERAYLKAIPDAENQLKLRRRPLQEAWEARGPGLLFFLKQFVPEDFVPEAADIVLVLPVSGGRGTAHLTYNSLRLEGVLYDPYPQLPEVVRLAWLLAQLNINLPKYGEQVHQDRLPLIARLAVLPAALAAAQEVELMRPGTVTLADALKLWQVTNAGHEALAEIVETWWTTQQAQDAPWNIALAALDRMLA